MNRFLKKLSRRQKVKKNNFIQESINDQTDLEQNEITDNLSLERKLNLPALVFLNVSNSIGSGIYVLTGIASYLYAGPYVSLSYLIAGIACLLSAFCFAEFASKIKSTSGSSYTFIYYSLGEFLAYLIGWMLFIGSLTAIAATSITWSTYLDAITNHAIKNFTINTLHAYWNFKTPFNNYLDIPAILITILIFLISSRGVKLTALFNNTFAILNITLLFIITIAGFVYGKFDNLTKVNYNNGFNGVFRGASVVMYAFMGFESSTYAINETINPSLNVPLSMIISVFIIILSYCGSSLALNLVQPFDQIDTHATYPTAFHDIKFMYIIVSIGPIISLMGSLISSIYATARIAYTMSKDGLLFKFLSSINNHTKIPDMATISSGIVCVFLVIVIDVKNLIGFTDVTGFLTYSMIGVGLLVVRYYDFDERSYDYDNENEIVESRFVQDDYDQENTTLIRQEIVNVNENRILNKKFFRNRNNAIILISFIYLFNVIYFGLFNYIESIRFYLLILIISTNFIFCLILCFFKQTTNENKKLTFKVPFVPFLPVLVIILNVYLMMASEPIEWIVFAILIVASLPIYFCYGIKNSKLENVSNL